MRRAWLAALLLPISAWAQGSDALRAPGHLDEGGPLPGNLGNPVIGAPLGANDPPHGGEAAPRVLPTLQGNPVQLSEISRMLVGKPVHGAGTGRIGVISGVVVGAGNRVTNVTVQVDAGLDPDRAHLPMPYAWIANQLDRPTLVVPWDPAMVAWLTEPGRSRRAIAVAPPPAAERAAFEQASEAQLEDWRTRIDARIPATADVKEDSGLRQLQLSYGAARARLERLREAEPEAWTTEQAKLQADLDDLNQSWGEVAEAR